MLERLGTALARLQQHDKTSPVKTVNFAPTVTSSKPLETKIGSYADTASSVSDLSSDSTARVEPGKVDSLSSTSIEASLPSDLSSQRDVSSLSLSEPSTSSGLPLDRHSEQEVSSLSPSEPEPSISSNSVFQPDSLSTSQAETESALSQGM